MEPIYVPPPGSPLKLQFHLRDLLLGIGILCAAAACWRYALPFEPSSEGLLAAAFLLTGLGIGVIFRCPFFGLIIALLSCIL